MTCRCGPNKCGRCFERVDLASQIISATARDTNKEPCLYMTDDAICVLRNNHAGEHKMERFDSVIPIE